MIVEWYETKEWRSLRWQCLSRDGLRCTRCGEYSHAGQGLQAHHIVPRPEGGRNLSNLITLCGECHDWVEGRDLPTRASIVGSSGDLLLASERQDAVIEWLLTTVHGLRAGLAEWELEIVENLKEERDMKSEGVCAHCSRPLPQGKTKRLKYCSATCRKAAWKRRQLTKEVPLEIPPVGRGARADRQNTPSEVTKSPATLKKQGVPSPLDGLDGGTELAGLAWLWVDPQREQGYQPKTFDQAAFLARAVALFQTKLAWNGQWPNVVKVHPTDIAGSFESVAATLGLQVIGDSKVTVDTYMLSVCDGNH